MMKSARVVRPIDANGRVVIPKNLITDVLKASPDEHVSVEFLYTEDSIILKRFQNSCSFCDNTENLKDFKGMKLCQSCIDKIKNL